MTTFINMTPHPITIARPGKEPWTLPPSGAIARAVESPTTPSLHFCDNDTQGDYETIVGMMQTGLTEHVGYVGVADLPTPTADAIAFGHNTIYVVSIVAVLGALAAGRTIGDLAVPMGQVRDAQGRIVGATGLAPADVLLTPVATRLHERWTASLMETVRKRNDQLAALQAQIAAAATTASEHQRLPGGVTG